MRDTRTQRETRPVPHVRSPVLAPSPEARSATRRLTFLVFAAALLLYVGTSGGSLSSTDATVTFDLTRRLVDEGSIALSGNLLGLAANRGVDGRYYSQYGIGQSLYNIPFYAVGRVIQHVTGLRPGKPDSLLKAGVGMGSAVAAAGTVAVVFVFALVLTGRAVPALLAAATCGVGSLLWPYARFGFNAPLAAWLLTTAVTSLWIGDRHDRLRPIVVAGFVAGAAWLTRHEFALIIGALVVWLAAADRTAPGRRWRRLIAFLPGILVAGVIWSAYNTSRFGHPLVVGYQPRYSAEGYWGLLASPGGSIFLYSPSVIVGLVALVAIARRDRATAWLLGLPALVQFVFVGALTDWPGGRSYGPRYLVPVLPLLAVAVAPLFQRAAPRGRRVILMTVAVSALVQLPGVFVDYSRVGQDWAGRAHPDDVRSRLSLWSASPLVLNARTTATAVPMNALYLTGRAQPPTVDVQASEERRDFAQQFTFSLDFWWVYLCYLGVLPRLAAIGIGFGLWYAACVLSLRAWRLAVLFDTTSCTTAPR